MMMVRTGLKPEKTMGVHAQSVREELGHGRSQQVTWKGW